MTPTQRAPSAQAGQLSLTRRQRAKFEGLWIELRWRRYARDPLAFFSEVVRIPNPRDERGYSAFDLYDYQQDDLERLQREQFLLILKARQLGLTTLLMGYALWQLMFRPGSNILLVSRDQRTADTALGLLDFLWRFLPPWFKERAPDQENDSARLHTWRFPDELTSRIVSLPATKKVGAGETATLVIWDEAALAEYQEDAYRTLLHTVSAGGQFVVFSTARGAHNYYAQLWRDAHKALNRFKTIFHPWFLSRFLNPMAARVRECPECGGRPKRMDGSYCSFCVDPTHYESLRTEFRDEPWLLHSEYPSDPEEAFRQSGRSRFPGLPAPEDFEEFPLRGRLVDTPGGGVRFTDDPQGPLRLRPDALQPPPWVKAVLSVDPATGQGGDYTAMAGGWIDREGTPQLMAYWHDNMVEPVDAAHEAARLGFLLSGKKPAKLVVEKQGGYGDTIIHELAANISYPNLYLHRYTGHRKRKIDTAYGFPMTWDRRPLVIDRLASWVPREDDDIGRPTLEGIHPQLRYELGGFVMRDDGRVAGDVGVHDDLVMSTAIWLYVLTESVGPATFESREEGGKPTVQRFTLDHMWSEVEREWERQDAAQARFGRRLVRARHNRQRER